MIGYFSYRVSPFGYLRIEASNQLPEAFRRFARPSSPFDAKTSSDSSYELNHLLFRRLKHQLGSMNFTY
jgi:hypothetical protein